MKTADINPFLRYAERQTLRPTSQFSVCSDCRLIYVLSGGFRLFFDNDVHDIEPETLIFWRPGKRYRFETDKIPEIILLNFDLTNAFSVAEDPLEILSERGSSPEVLHIEPDTEDFKELNSFMLLRRMSFVESALMEIVCEFRDRKRYFRETASATLKLVICETARTVASGGIRTDVIERVISFIRSNFRRQITNKDISEFVSYNDFYVNKLIKRETGMTLHRYLQVCRLQEASRLLSTTDASVADIANLCGFTSDAYFISAFKREYGLSPNAYRRARGGLI